MRRVLAIVVALGALALADDKPAKAPTPGDGVIMLKIAWDAGDLDAVVLRYAEPGASYLRSDLAALKKVEEAQQELGRVVRAKLGAAAEQELGALRVRRTTSPLANASVTLVPGTQRIKGDRAATKFRVALRDERGNPDGERFFRYKHVLAPDGDWKIVLTSTDGVPLDERAFKKMAAATAAHARAASELEKTARDVETGALPGKDAVRKRIVQVLDDERRAVEQEQRGDDELHEND